ncbi:Ulp1 peptidase [Sarracenia purpurea var. burkii]
MTSSSSKRFKVFEFNEKDERVEKTSKKILRKFGIPKSDKSPVTKYSFLQCFAQGTKAKQNTVTNRILDVDASDDRIKEAIPVLDATVPSASLSYKPATRPIHLDSESSFSGLNCYAARVPNREVTSLGSRHLERTLPQFLSDNEPVTINSDDDDDGIELSSSTSASEVAENSDVGENEGLLKEQALDHHSGECIIETTVVVSPDYIIYEARHCPKSLLIFSCCRIKVEGSLACGTKGPFSFEWTVGDIINIESQWYAQVETAVINLRLKSKNEKAAENANTSSGIVELKFAVFDPNWCERQEAIKSLNVRYKANWNLVSDRTARSEDSFVGSNNIFFSKHYFSNPGEPFDEVIYPKGDPDAVSISKRDIELLQPETFINDTIIDFYIKYLKNKIKPKEKHRFHFFNSFFFRKLADLDKDPSQACEGRAAFQRVGKWTRKVDLFGKDYIFIPVNFSLHWSLIVICHPGDIANIEDEDVEKLPKVPCILHMDSMKGSHRGLKNLFQSYLWEEWKERRKQLLEDVAAKFLNLRFVPLELPQQENSFDCGLFLLHYVELFLDCAPVGFSPFKISNSNFLNKDWFPPAEASLKRIYIKKLIGEIFEENSFKATLDLCSDDKCPSELPGLDERDIGVEFLQDTYNSSEIICHSNYSSSTADQEIEIIPLAAGGAQCSKEQKSVFGELLEQSAAGDLNFDESNQCFGQMVSLDRLKNVAMSPIEEGEETWEQVSYSPTNKAGGQAAEVTESFVPAYSSKELRTRERSSFRVDSMHLLEYEDGYSLSGSSVGGCPVPSEIGVSEDLPPEEFLGTNPSGVKEKSKSPSTPSNGLATCIVEDSEEEDVTCGVNEIQKSPFCLRKIIGSSNHEMNTTEHIVDRGTKKKKKSRLMRPEGGRPC